MANGTESPLGEILARARKERGWSLRELADKVEGESGNVSPQYLNDLEHNRRTPSESVIASLAHALKLDEVFLFHLAGRLHPDLANVTDEQTIKAAYQAFRKTVRKSA